MNYLLEKLFNHQTLEPKEAENLLNKIVSGEANKSQVVAAITCILMRTVTEEEARGFRAALLDQCLVPDLFTTEAIDVCGTGGDGKNTFNISTLTAIVIAGAGYKVIKHGNYGASSICGSSNLLEQIGYRFSSGSDSLNRQLDDANLVFLHAPIFHPCLKSVAEVRKELGVRTFFNFLGPLVNPVQPDYQLSGVFNLQVGRIYRSILRNNRKSFRVVHSTDGYDEVSLTSPFKQFSETDDHLVFPEELGMKQLNQFELRGGSTVKEAKKIFEDILEGQGTSAQNAVVLTNAALGIQCFNQGQSFESAYEEARCSLMEGKSRRSIELAINKSNQSS